MPQKISITEQRRMEKPYQQHEVRAGKISCYHSGGGHEEILQAESVTHQQSTRSQNARGLDKISTTGKSLSKTTFPAHKCFNHGQLVKRNAELIF